LFIIPLSVFAIFSHRLFFRYFLLLLQLSESTRANIHRAPTKHRLFKCLVKPKDQLYSQWVCLLGIWKSRFSYLRSLCTIWKTIPLLLAHIRETTSLLFLYRHVPPAATSGTGKLCGVSIVLYCFILSELNQLSLLHLLRKTLKTKNQNHNTITITQ